jgi:hypothetical protein
MGASVWIAPTIVNSFGAGMLRPTALTMPDVTVCGRPNGPPMATTGSPTRALSEFANAIGCSSEAAALTRMTATSVDGSVPMTLALAVVPSPKVTVAVRAPETTCSSVRMSPFLSKTTPAPSACASCLVGRPSGPGDVVVVVTRISTTPAQSRR